MSKWVGFEWGTFSIFQLKKYTRNVPTPQVNFTKPLTNKKGKHVVLLFYWEKKNPGS